jgi:hypothetical protein
LLLVAHSAMAEFGGGEELVRVYENTYHQEPQEHQR